MINDVLATMIINDACCISHIFVLITDKLHHIKCHNFTKSARVEILFSSGYKYKIKIYIKNKFGITSTVELETNNTIEEFATVIQDHGVIKSKSQHYCFLV